MYNACSYFWIISLWNFFSVWLLCFKVIKFQFNVFHLSCSSSEIVSTNLHFILFWLISFNLLLISSWPVFDKLLMFKIVIHVLLMFLPIAFKLIILLETSLLLCLFQLQCQRKHLLLVRTSNRFDPKTTLLHRVKFVSCFNQVHWALEIVYISPVVICAGSKLFGLWVFIIIALFWWGACRSI